VISSQWLWDWNVLGLIYDGLIGRNPYDLSQVQYMGLATNVVVGTWTNGTDTMTKVTFTPRAGVKWHDGVAFDVNDIIFSWEFTKKCGAGVAWNYASVADMNHTEVTGGGDAVIYYNVKSMFCQWWAGGLPIIPKHIWETQFPDWNTLAFNPTTVRTYHAWTVPLNQYVKGNPALGNLTAAIGTGAWIYPYGGWVSGTSITLIANNADPYYLTETQVNNFIGDSFWRYKGDATAHESPAYDVGKVSGYDVLDVKNHYFGIGSYDAACDFNNDGFVNSLDFSLVERNFGKTSG